MLLALGCGRGHLALGPSYIVRRAQSQVTAPTGACGNADQLESTVQHTKTKSQVVAFGSKTKEVK